MGIKYFPCFLFIWYHAAHKTTHAFDKRLSLVPNNPSLLSRISPFLLKTILYKWKILNNSCCVTALYAQNIVFYGHFVVGKSPHGQNTTFHVCFFSSADNQYFLHVHSDCNYLNCRVITGVNNSLVKGRSACGEKCSGWQSQWQCDSRFMLW